MPEQDSRPGVRAPESDAEHGSPISVGPEEPPQDGAGAASPRSGDETLRAVADAIPFPFSYVGRDGRYRFHNVAYGDWLGAPAEQLVGHRVEEVVGEEAYGLLRAPLQEALAGHAVSLEQEITFRGAGPRYVAVTFTPDRNRGGDVRGAYSLIQDRTQARRRELDLREAIAREALAEQSQRRTLAKELDDEFGQMLSLVSMKLEAVRDAGSRERSRLLAEVSRLVRATRGRVASLSYHVSPSILYDVGFVAAAEWLAEELEREDGLRVRVHSSGELEALDDAGRIILFRALHGLLSGLQGESPRTAHVRIERKEGRATLEVSELTLPTRDDEDTVMLGATRTLVEQLGGDVVFEGAGRSTRSIRIELPMRSSPLPGTRTQ